MPDAGCESLLKRSLSNLGELAPKDLEEIQPGICVSACAWAFLGGAVRNTPVGSNIGFHQFYNVLGPEERVKEALRVLNEETPVFSVDQMISGLLVEYLMAMNIDPRVFRLSAEAGPREMKFPSRDVLEELRIISPSGLGAWDLEPYQAGLVAFAREADSESLLQQITLFCRASGEVVLMGMSIAHPQRSPMFKHAENGRETWWPGIEIEIDGRLFEISHHRIDERISEDGTHYAMAARSALEVESLLAARSLNIRYTTAHYLGSRSTHGALSQKDRDSLQVTLQNCTGG